MNTKTTSNSEASTNILKNLCFNQHIMKKTLVLVVDRDDDFGVKADVQTPVIGVNNCLEAASQFGVIDPEDSDLNALYCAISVYLELQEDGKNAEVALICGDEHVGHRSDLTLVSELEDVLDQVMPDSVVLVGDGAEDEYIYPIISSRAHVDSVRKVFVKQAPGLEGSLYIITRMLSDPGKRKRFLAPVGILMMLLSLFFILPRLFIYTEDHNIDVIVGMSGSLALFCMGFIITLYGYNVGDKMDRFKGYVVDSVMKNSTSFIFLCLSLAVILIGTIYSVVEISKLYIVGGITTITYFISSLVWPVAMGIYTYIAGMMIVDLQQRKTISLSKIFYCLNVTSVALVAIGILDFALTYMNSTFNSTNATFEIVLGIALSVFVNFLKAKIAPKKAGTDEVL